MMILTPSSKFVLTVKAIRRNERTGDISVVAENGTVIQLERKEAERIGNLAEQPLADETVELADLVAELEQRVTGMERDLRA